MKFINLKSKQLKVQQFKSQWLLLSAILSALVFAPACSKPKYPKCDTDDHCKEGEFCVQGQCQQCRGDSDCGAGLQCMGGRCDEIPGYCESGSDCAEGETCENNRCIAPVSEEPVKEEAPVEKQSGCEIKTISFTFDSDALESTARDTLSSNASCLKEKEVSSIHLTGYCDPRGTEEYNLALGDRRARAVKKYLKSLGYKGKASASSMGEEMAQGSDESGWQKDRRVEITIK